MNDKIVTEGCAMKGSGIEYVSGHLVVEPLVGGRRG